MRRLVAQGAATTSMDVPMEGSARDRVRSRRNARKRRKVLRIATVVLLVVGVLGSMYSAGFSHYSSHYYPGTTVAGIDASGMTEDELTRVFNASVLTYESEVSHDAMRLSFAAADIDLAAEPRATAHRLLSEQNASEWLAGALGMKARHDRGVTFNTQKLFALVQDAVKEYNKKATAPSAAALAYNKRSKTFSLTPEKDGTMLDPTATYKAVRDAVALLQTDVTLGDEVLQQPEATEHSEQAQAALRQANTVLDQRIPLVRGGEELAVVDASTFGEWLTTEGLSVAFDQGEATAWVDENLWTSLDYADDNNVYAVDSAALVAAMTEYVNTDGAAPIEIPYTVTPRYLPSGGALNPVAWNAEYGRYIDINKTNQVACMFDATGRVLWESDVTTGTENEKTHNGTPEGEFGIYDKQADFVLLGEDLNNDGQPDYERPVDYWMPFNGNIGLHDASWRTVYGGEEYKKSGSSGCVNLPKDAAAALFAIAHVGDVVIVHY